jgi:hypothetical protein
VTNRGISGIIFLLCKPYCFGIIAAKEDAVNAIERNQNDRR